MAPGTINILLTSFPGLNLPSTLCIPVPSTTSVSETFALVSNRIAVDLTTTRLFLTTNSNKQLSSSSTAPLTSLFPTSDRDTSILPLRLTAPLCGGKGGFGSQLRAAGGRMSSRKKRNQGDSNGSSRNLDGRRLRTVNEAKALAEYLAVKPEMEKKEKEERRKRWEEVVQTAERREEEIKSGKGKGKVDGKWAEDKEEQENKMREAVLAAMKRGLVPGASEGSDESLEGSDESESAEDDIVHDVGESSAHAETAEAKTAQFKNSKKIYGWDDEDDDVSEDDE